MLMPPIIYINYIGIKPIIFYLWPLKVRFFKVYIKAFFCMLKLKIR